MRWGTSVVLAGLLVLILVAAVAQFILKVGS
jgi:hypothetical protein